MEVNDKERFLQMLKKAMGAYDRKLPDPDIIDVWFDMLKPYSLSVIGRAFLAYCDSEPEFAPKAASIAARCKLMDGRPTADEAWAIALLSRDESDTVVWTEETARAMAACSSILELGDEVGARRSFIDSYNRMVAESRLNGVPAKWNVSLGHDPQRREIALQRAQTDGLLPAPVASALLPAPSGFEAPTDEKSRAGIARVKAELERLQSGWAANAEKRAAEAEQRRQQEQERKRQIYEQVKKYQEGSNGQKED